MPIFLIYYKNQVEYLCQLYPSPVTLEKRKTEMTKKTDSNREFINRLSWVHSRSVER
jgi:hypothetical protein